MASYIDKKKKTIDLFDDFDTYVIQEFNPSLRSQLINKWYRLGKEYIDETERNQFFKIDNHDFPAQKWSMVKD